MMMSARYQGSVDSVQGSFKPASFQNIAISAVNAASTALNEGVVLISASDYYYLEIGATATTSSMVMPAGMVSLLVDKGDTLNFLQLDVTAVASIIVPA